MLAVLPKSVTGKGIPDMARALAGRENYTIYACGSSASLELLEGSSKSRAGCQGLVPCAAYPYASTRTVST